MNKVFGISFSQKSINQSIMLNGFCFLSFCYILNDMGGESMLNMCLDSVRKQ